MAERLPISPSDVIIANADTGKVIGHCTNFVVNVDRQKLPILQLGNKEPVGFGRGFRIISGMIDYVALKQDILFEILGTFELEGADSIKKIETVQTADDIKKYEEVINNVAGALGIKGYTPSALGDTQPLSGFSSSIPYALDMLPPLNLLVIGVNDNGNASYLKIKGLEFSSSSFVITLNDVAMAQRAAWIAKSYEPWIPATV